MHQKAPIVTVGTRSESGYELLAWIARVNPDTFKHGPQ